MSSWRGPTWIGVGLASALLATVTVMPGVLALFDDAPTVPNNTLAAENTFGGTYFTTGEHTGDAVDNRAITGLGFSPELVILKGSTTQIAQARATTMAGDVTKPLTGATAITGGSNRIQSLTADGFTLGNNATVNGSNIAYSWAAFNAVAGGLVVGSYAGNGTSQSISGLGFQPRYVIVLSAGAQAPVHRSVTMTTTYRFDATAATADGITSLDANGFSVGNSAQTNASGVVHHFAAFNVATGASAMSSYAGTGVAKSVAVGFEPEYVIVKSTGSTTLAVHRVDALAGDSTMQFTGASNATNRITAIEVNGFRVGTNATVNTNAVTYHYIAFNDP